jgi:D-alanyl-D-alanine carboxypeptidase
MGLLPVLGLHAQKRVGQFKHAIDTAFAAHPAAVGIMACVITEDGKAWTYAAGVSDRVTKARLQADQPVLIASNTKTYVAAAILKLEERGKLDISDPIGKYLPGRTLQKLGASSYDTRKISILQLLSHTSGIDDYVDDAYFDTVNAHPQHRWTRAEQIERAAAIGRPLAQPGDTFKYADVNYLLLTEIIEGVTGQPFYESIRSLVGYDALKLNATWFLSLEPAPRHIPALAHQYWNKYPWDSYGLDPSWDLFGGGGIAATPSDLALFFKDIFEGKIVKDTSVLAKMYTNVPCKNPANYCLGIRKLKIAGLTAYYHGGFWGTDAIYFPDLKTAICIVVLEKSERDISAEICKAMVAIIQHTDVKQYRKTAGPLRQ